MESSVRYPSKSLCSFSQLTENIQYRPHLRREPADGARTQAGVQQLPAGGNAILLAGE